MELEILFAAAATTTAAAATTATTTAATAAAATTGAQAHIFNDGKLTNEQQSCSIVSITAVTGDGNDSVVNQQSSCLAAHGAADNSVYTVVNHKLDHCIMAVLVSTFNYGLLAAFKVHALIFVDGESLAVTKMLVNLAVFICNSNFHI